MKYTLPKGAVVLFAGLLIFAARPVGADGFTDRFSWAVNGTIIWFAANNGNQGSDPMAVLPSVGASAALHLWGPLSIELTEDLYFTNYEYNTAKGYPMASNPENRSAFVLGFLTGLQASALFPLGSSGIFQARAYAGPTMDLRIITLAQNLHPDDVDAQMQTDAIRSYFWGRGRWFMPVIGGGLDFPINEKFLLGLDLRIWMPMYRLWTNEDIPGIDGWRFGLGLRVTPRSNRPKDSA